jgi:hypothetical protein
MSAAPADAPAGAGGAAGAASRAPPDPRDEYACKEPHAVRVLDSHMPEALERDAALVAAAAVERHGAKGGAGALKDVARFVVAGVERLSAAAGRRSPAAGAYHCVVGKSFASEPGC